jgi:hypothetical protein
MTMKRHFVCRLLRPRGWSCIAFFACAAVSAWAQQSPVAIKVEIVQTVGSGKASPASRSVDASNVVVWLTPLDGAPGLPVRAPGEQKLRLIQRNKQFEPHVLVVPTGSQVEFPNEDPFFHNVFSLFDGKRFDLGLYESGSSRTVHFDHTGVSFLFCNIHPDMSAVVVAVDTPYFGLSDRSGKVTIANVPDGRYRLNVWYERSLPEDLKRLDRTITVSGSQRSVETIQLVENAKFNLEHKNKYGQDYVPPSSTPY